MLKGGIKTTALSAAVVFLVAADRLLKAWAVNFKPEIKLIGGWFRIVLAKNPGIAFSLPLDGTLVIILIWLAILGLIGYFIFLIKKTAVLEAVFIFAVILGAGSNLYDRLKFGYVIDYFDLSFYSVFNLADAMIMAGIIGLLLVGAKTVDKKPEIS